MQVMQGSAVYFQLVQFDHQEMSNSCENSICYPYMYAACFGLYIGCPQACQYTNNTEEDTIKI
jgi:hypothetical protein